ncbi:hypothetical protein EVJ58_g7427 [Rhodofomes roseus]|uniref:Transmembrane protein n=1 Tax=Rhodofomes roseus TaxID=34475 RepID=A0A4Y9Y2V2_9APHY|nr:hypothetical protein EVJ58_g7427 [Rhodofomes roseus]
MSSDDVAAEVADIAYNLELSYVQNSCMVATAAADVIVLVVTWRNTYNIQKEASVVNLRTPTITLLLRDGTIYFTLLLILNVLHLALEITDVFWDITYFVTGFSSIVISRFLLNLRQVHADEERDGTQPSFIASHVSGLNFASTIIGNLGEHLDHGRFVTSPAEFQHSYGETEGATGPDDLEIPREQWAPGSEPFEEGSTSSPTQSDEIHTLA